jgi:L-fuculose-phosphate aldolase
VEDERALRAEIVSVGRALRSRGLTTGRSGNVSARFADGFLITPSGVPYEAMSESDAVHVPAEGPLPAPAPGARTASSEWQLHQAIYRARPEAKAIVHAHPRASAALASLRREIPAFHYMVAIAGGRSIRCAPYATYGTPELAVNAVEALRDRSACLLANHGSIAFGSRLVSTLDKLEEVEWLAATYLEAVRAGTPVILPDVEMARVLEKFKNYGR